MILLKILIIITFVAFIIAIISMACSWDKLMVVSLMIASISFVTGIILEYCLENEQTPTALDVYRGKTTLEITYRDSIAVDSVVVVYKEK